MKLYFQTLFLSFLFFLLHIHLQGQGINYQAVARNAGGQLMAHESITVRFSIFEESPQGFEVYQESHIVSTNASGLFSAVIGKGTTELGVFEVIDWGAEDHFLQVEVNGEDMGMTQLESVPYSKVATEMSIDHLTDVDIEFVQAGQVLKWNGSYWSGERDEVEDDDSDPSNELQTLSVVGDALILSNGNSVVLPDNVDDADADPNNEKQDLSLNGNTLVLSKGGGSVMLPVSPWNENGADIYFQTGKVGIGMNASSSSLSVRQPGGLQTTTAHFQHTGLSGHALMLEGGSTFGGKLLGFKKNGTTVADVSVTGAANFQNVTVRDELGPTTSPIKGRVYANGLPVAYGYIGTFGAILKNYGLSNVTRPSTGEYKITLDKQIDGYPVIICTSNNNAGNDEIITANTVNGAANEIEVNITDGSGAATNSAFFFIVYGDIQ